MEDIVKDLKDLREMIINDCAADEQLLTVEERQWIGRIDSITMKAETIFNNVDLADVSVSLFYKEITKLAFEKYPIQMGNIVDEEDWDMNEQYREPWIEGYKYFLNSR